MSALMGTLNILAGVGSGMAATVAEYGKTYKCFDSKLASRVLAGMIASGTEVIYDLTSYILGKLYFLSK